MYICIYLHVVFIWYHCSACHCSSEAATLVSRSWSSGQRKTVNGPSWELTDLTAVSHDVSEQLSTIFRVTNEIHAVWLRRTWCYTCLCDFHMLSRQWSLFDNCLHVLYRSKSTFGKGTSNLLHLLRSPRSAREFLGEEEDLPPPEVPPTLYVRAQDIVSSEIWPIQSLMKPTAIFIAPAFDSMRPALQSSW